MKILLMLPHLGKGGAEELIVRLATDFSETHDVTILLFFKTAEQAHNLSRLPSSVKINYVFQQSVEFLGSGKIIRLLTAYLLSPFLAIYISLRFRLSSFEIIHANLTLPCFYLPLLSALRGLKFLNSGLVITFHSNTHLLKGFSKAVNLLSWRFPDVLVYEIFKDEARSIQRHAGKTRVEFIPFGYRQPAAHASRTPVRSMAIEQAISSGKRVLMTISRIRFFEKKIDLMLRAVWHYRKQNKDFVFIIAGDGEDMGLAKALCHELELDENVLFTGYIDDALDFSKYADVFLVAAVGDNVGVAGMQAMANHVAVVGIQTLSGFEQHNLEGMLSDCSAEGVAQLIARLDDRANLSVYQATIQNIALRNAANHDQFSLRYLALYSELRTGSPKRL